MKAANLRLDQPVAVRAEEGRVIIEPAIPEYGLKELLAGITLANLHSEADFGGLQGCEML